MFQSSNVPETERINFILNRDGEAGAIDYCRRTMGIYRSAVLQTIRRGHKKAHFASTSQFKPTFIRSYLAFKKFLNDRGQLKK